MNRKLYALSAAVITAIGVAGCSGGNYPHRDYINRLEERQEIADLIGLHKPRQSELLDIETKELVQPFLQEYK